MVDGLDGVELMLAVALTQSAVETDACMECVDVQQAKQIRTCKSMLEQSSRSSLTLVKQLPQKSEDSQLTQLIINLSAIQLT